VLGEQAGWAWWAAYCVMSTVLAQAQPAVALALPAQAAGRALSAFNLAIFSGVFVVQWGFGLVVDGFAPWGWEGAARFQGAVGVFAAACMAAYGLFWRRARQAAALGR
jgi:hypothetical protein